METISYHSNQSSYSTRIKNIALVEGNVISKYAKFQLHPPYGFREEVFFLEHVLFISPCQPINLSDLDIVEDFSINISVKKNISPKYSAEMVNFHFSHYMSMESISCHSSKSSYPTGVKNITFRSPYLLMLFVYYGKNRPHSLRGVF